MKAIETITAMRAALESARAIVQQDRTELAEGHTSPITLQLDAAGRQAVIAYDGVLSEIDRALAMADEVSRASAAAVRRQEVAAC